MLGVLLSDLVDVPDIGITTTRDPRLEALDLAVATRIPRSAEDIWALWQQCIDEADAVWGVAPESGGMLERIAEMAQSKWLGCTVPAVRIAGSKRATAMHLAARNIPVVPTWLPAELQAGGSTSAACWVAKPDDGVGCDDMRVFADVQALHTWLKDGRQASHVVQPWLAGEAASISMLCRNGVAQLLSCNRQLISTVNDGIHYRGSVLNGMAAAHWDVFESMAARVAAAMPGLSGYVGVDVMVHDGQLTVLEINPRLTTSYVGLRRAIGVNPAELALDLHYNGRFIEPERLQRNVVEVNVDD